MVIITTSISMLNMAALPLELSGLLDLIKGESIKVIGDIDITDVGQDLF